jgi:hypothetical protein
VAVTAADLTYHVGEIRADWFPDETLATVLAAWIAAGTLLVPVGATTEQSDAIVRAYAYGTAYDAILLRMAGAPGSAGLGDLSAAWSKDQRDRFAEKSAEWWAAFDTALAVSDTVVSAAPRASFAQQAVTVF